MLLSRDLSLIELGMRALPENNQILVQAWLMDFQPLTTPALTGKDDYSYLIDWREICFVSRIFRRLIKRLFNATGKRNKYE
ncbi:hypothetical protein EV13_2325 [Prochlorococcus sp. MIT 0702]|nr:hypothetical protein EV12_1955 [Prochlorococcus sp. MIT 0701]KGG26864.1 hypothetical protein EV13_2325 [Prochlorococcus sp. MIT 0702]KGG36140.1 hypothetical protein EV14_0549 [Prochlorococcus sp. MIT 0703]